MEWVRNRYRRDTEREREHVWNGNRTRSVKLSLLGFFLLVLYVLYSDNTWVFDQSEHVQGPIYILIHIVLLTIVFSGASYSSCYLLFVYLMVVNVYITPTSGSFVSVTEDGCWSSKT